MKLPVTTAVPLDNSALSELTAFACELADAAGEVILPYFKRPVATDHKPGRGRFDPVTVADRAAEAAMRQLISERYPQHSVFGEEQGYTEGESGLTWVLDPIDGTRAFIAGVPVWGTLIALYNGQRSVIGVADQPYLQERYIGNDQQAQLQRYGTDCYAYCMVASGFVDVVIESGLEPYDIQALIPIVERAGGRVTDWQGGNALHRGQVVAVGCESLLDEVTGLLNQSV